MLLQQVSRSRRARPRTMRLAPILAVYVVLCGGVAATWMLRPQTGSIPAAKTATIRSAPQSAKPAATDSTASRSRPSAPTASSRAAGNSPSGLDRDPVGTIETLETQHTLESPDTSRPMRGFSEIERAAPERYTGFREIPSR